MADYLQHIFLAVAPFLCVITLIVTVHELGHFLTARAFGVAIDCFSIGFGRAMASWRDRHGVEWRIAWLPLGGYVRFSGDENAAGVPDKDDLAALRQRIVEREGPGAEMRYLAFKPLWQRALIVLAGPMANFAFAAALFALIFMIVGALSTPFTVGAVEPGSPAGLAGFHAGDRIVSANRHRIEGFEDLRTYLAPREGETVRFGVVRGDERLTLTAKLARAEERDAGGGVQAKGLLGIWPKPAGAWVYVRQNPLSAMGMGIRRTWDLLTTTAYYVGKIVTGKIGLGQLHGFVGMAKASGEMTRQAIADSPKSLPDQVSGVLMNLIAFSALISVSIGFMNLLPVPILDGGHLMFYAYEWIAKRPLDIRVQAAGYRLGLALLVGLMLFANLHDLAVTRVFHFFGSLFS
jgi:regulator of sigma E protease